MHGDMDSAEARATGVLAQDEATFFGFASDQADHCSAVFTPIVAPLNVNFAWRGVGSALVYTLNREEAG